MGENPYESPASADSEEEKQQRLPKWLTAYDRQLVDMSRAFVLAILCFAVAVLAYLVLFARLP